MLIIEYKGITYEISNINENSGLLFNLTNLCDTNSENIIFPENYESSIINYITFLQDNSCYEHVTREQLKDHFHFYYYNDDKNYFKYLISWFHKLWPCYWIFEINIYLQREIWLHMPYQLLPLEYSINKVFVNEWGNISSNKSITINNSETYHHNIEEILDCKCITLFKTIWGLRFGKVEEYFYYKSGEIKTYETFLEWQKHGRHISFYENGNVESEVDYHLDMKHGITNNYYTDNRLSISGYYLQNKKTGLWTWYHVNGQIEKTVNYKDDLEDGYSVEFTQDGEKICNGNYECGLKHGLWTYYHADGVIPYIEEYYVEGEKHGNYKCYYESGNLEIHGQYENDVIVGTWTMYYDTIDKQIQNYGNYINNCKFGVWTGYYLNGKKEYSHTYKNDMLHGTYITYYDNLINQIASYGLYLNNNISGIWITYSENGDITKFHYYSGDRLEE